MPLRKLAGGGESPNIDIVAVHGLNPRQKAIGAHAWDTWRKPAGQEGRLWLRDYLPRDFPRARIFLYEYDSTVLGSNKEMFVDAANALLEWLRIERDENPRRPLLFISHSLGGLLVKQALVNAHNNSFHRDLEASVFALVFFGTPHEGGNPSLVKVGSTAAHIAKHLGFGSNDSIMDALKSGSIFSGCLREAFRHQLGKYQIVSFWEGKGNIVSKESATFGLQGTKENIVRLDADHRSMCKFDLSCQHDADGYKLVVGNLKTLYRDCTSIGEKKNEIFRLEKAIDDSIGAYFVRCSLRVTPTTKNIDVERDMSWVISTSAYQSWSTCTHPGLVGAGATRVLWCQTADSLERLHMLRPFFLQRWRDPVLGFNFSGVIPPPSYRLSTRSDSIMYGISEAGANSPPPTATKTELEPCKLTSMLWQLIYQSFMAVSVDPSRDAFIQHIRMSGPHLQKNPSNELDQLTHLLIASLNEHEGRATIILDRLDSLGDEGMMQLDRVVSKLLQKSRRVKILLLSQFFKPSQLQEDASLVDRNTAYNECCETFYFQNMNQRRDQIATACIGTNHWVWSHPSYLEWASESGPSALWIAGKPGSGKSVLARTIEDNLTKKAGFETAMVSTWFYSTRDNLLNHAKMLSSLIYQMLRKEKRIFRRLSDRYRQKRGCPGDFSWSFDDLRTIFGDILRDCKVNRPFLFVIDGIDETRTKSTDEGCKRSSLLRYVLETIESAPKGQAKVIFLSRLEDDLRIVFRPVPSIIMHQVNSDDIVKLVDVGMQNICEELRLLEDCDSDPEDLFICQKEKAFSKSEAAQQKLIQHIRKHLIENADGVILWVSSVMSHIQMQVGTAFCSLAQLANEVKSLPTELSEVYARIVQNISQGLSHSPTMALAQRALIWVRLNPVPGRFHAGDLLGVLRIDLDHAGDEWTTVTSWNSFQRQLTRLCGPFIEIVGLENAAEARPYQPVQLLHQTVKTFLDDPKQSSPLHLSPEECKERLMEDCVKYLKNALPEHPHKKHPLHPDRQATLGKRVSDILDYLEGQPLLSYILTYYPEMASHVPECHKNMLKSIIMTPPFLGGLGIKGIRGLFHRACIKNQTNGLCSLFAISSLGLHPWEWYLLEPDIISGTVHAARTLASKTERINLSWYVACRDILPRPVQERRTLDQGGLRSNGAQQASVSENLAANPESSDSDVSAKLVAKSSLVFSKKPKYSTGPSGNVRGYSSTPRQMRGVNEVLCFFLRLATTTELQARHAFRGADKPHLSESIAIGRRMAMIRTTALKSGRPSGVALHGKPKPTLPEQDLKALDGLRQPCPDLNVLASCSPLVDSALSQALAKIEEVPIEDNVSPFTSVVLQQKFVGQGVVSTDYFSDLPPVLPAFLPNELGSTQENTDEANAKAFAFASSGVGVVPSGYDVSGWVSTQIGNPVTPEGTGIEAKQGAHTSDKPR